MANKKQQTQASLMKFRRTPSAGGTSTSTTEGEGSEPRFLTTDTSLTHVVTMIGLRCCRRLTVDIEREKRLLFYFCLIVFGGIVGDFAPILCKAFMPIRTDKSSYVNQYFVKIGWFWTLVLMVPFIAMTSEVMSSFVSKEEAIKKESGDESHDHGNENNKSSKMKKIKYIIFRLLSKDTARMIVNTIVWYVSVNSFVSIEKSVGSCSLSSVTIRETCMKKGGSWTGFDISGHTFLLMFSTLLMLEEVSVMIGWEHPFGNHLKEKNQVFTKTLRVGPNKQFVTFEKLSTFIRINFIFVTFFILVWDFMLIQTALFYHTMIQKAAAGLWAALSWFVLYKIVFRLDFLQGFIRPPSRPFMEP